MVVRRAAVRPTMLHVIAKPVIIGKMVNASATATSCVRECTLVQTLNMQDNQDT